MLIWIVKVPSASSLIIDVLEQTVMVRTKIYRTCFLLCTNKIITDVIQNYIRIQVTCIILPPAGITQQLSASAWFRKFICKL